MYWNWKAAAGGVSSRQINRNMRCIEMHQWSMWYKPRPRLIETWDVLKFDAGRDAGHIVFD